MSWAVGYDSNWKRDVGYGVPATCDDPDCETEIDRGLGHVCGGDIYGGDHGCGLFFCCSHLAYAEGPQQCDRCIAGAEPFDPKPDVAEWINWKLTDESWGPWRSEYPEEVERLKVATQEVPQ